MVDLNTLILNSCRSQDICDTTQPQIDTDDLQEINKDKDDNDLLITQGSFLILLTELFTKAPTETNTGESEEINSKSVEQLASESSLVSSAEVNKPGLEYSSPEQLQNNQITGSVQFNQTPLIKLDNNVALTWIDYEHFEPPLSGSNIDNAEQFLSGVEDALLNQNKESVKFSVTHTDESIENDTLLEYNEFSLQKINSTNTNTFELFKETSELIEPAFDRSLQVGGDKSELAQNTLHSGLISNQLNQNMSESVKPKILDISVPISESQWADKFSGHIIWMGHQGVKSAVIKINPEDLGPLEISVKVVKESASVSVISPSSHVHEIVDQALPKLREMMAAQGLDLADVTYVTGTSADSRQSDQQNNGTNQTMAMDVEEGALVTSLKKRPSKGLIDYFA